LSRDDGAGFDHRVPAMQSTCKLALDRYAARHSFCVGQTGVHQFLRFHVSKLFLSCTNNGTSNTGHVCIHQGVFSMFAVSGSNNGYNGKENT